MTGTATSTGRDVSFWGDGTSHWYLDPPLDGHDHIVICDRGALLRVTHVEGEPDDLEIPTRIPTLVEIFAANTDGTLAGNTMTTLREPVSLHRNTINIDQILAGLGYTQ